LGRWISYENAVYARWDALRAASFRYEGGCSLAVPPPQPFGLPEPVVTYALA
jgi:hypothetical protein